uniref:Fur family transcriptional regulator n=1 Tax=Nocardia brasiliensis TaxID=37326 RepID=UPI003D7A0144
VYAVGRACGHAGYVRRIVPAGAAAVSETRTGHNHHHLVGRSCGTVVDIDCVVGAAPCLEPDDAHGFAIDEAEVVFWGLCPQCRTSARQES